MKFGFQLLGITLISMAMFALPALASADEQNADKTQSNSSQQQQFTDKQLKRFARAQEDVQETMQKWQVKLDEADDDDKAKLRKKRNEDMTEAVENSGLDAKTYNRIAQQAQKDEQLTQRIQKFMTPQ